MVSNETASFALSPAAKYSPDVSPNAKVFMFVDPKPASLSVQFCGGLMIFTEESTPCSTVSMR